MKKASNKDISKFPENKQYYELQRNGFPEVPVSLESFTKTFVNYSIDEEKGNYNTNFVYYLKDKPIAMAGIQELGTIQNKRIAILGGAVTHKEFQGNGLYSSLLNERIVDAKQKGINIIITDARSTTSSPILQKFGLKKIDTINVLINPSWNEQKFRINES